MHILKITFTFLEQGRETIFVLINFAFSLFKYSGSIKHGQENTEN